MQLFAELRQFAMQAKKPKATSRYIGVTGYSRRWRARIGTFYVGTFRTEKEAAEARDEEAIRQKGKCVQLCINMLWQKPHYN